VYQTRLSRPWNPQDSGEIQIFSNPPIRITAAQ
jgi:hypothetical protein